jgi:large subunit ribosomal protein L18
MIRHRVRIPKNLLRTRITLPIFRAPFLRERANSIVMTALSAKSEGEKRRMNPQTKKRLKQLRRYRIRKKVSGTSERPRMVTTFSNTHIYVQFIDDLAGKTIASASTRHKNAPDRENLGANVKSATLIGKAAAEAAQSKGIKSVVFDRAGTRYHGKIKALADAAREAGLQF